MIVKRPANVPKVLKRQGLAISVKVGALGTFCTFFCELRSGSSTTALRRGNI